LLSIVASLPTSSPTLRWSKPSLASPTLARSLSFRRSFPRWPSTTRLAGLTHELLVSCLWAGPCFIISSTAPSTVELLPSLPRPHVLAKRASSGASALCEVISQCGDAFRVIKSTLHFADVGAPSWSTIPTRIRLLNVFTFLLTINAIPTLPTILATSARTLPSPYDNPEQLQSWLYSMTPRLCRRPHS
jgi:hypothetical protein